MLPQLPDTWTWAPVADLAAPEPRAITDGPFGSNLKTAHYTESGPRVIRLQNIGDGEFLDARAHISEARFELLRAHEARAGDVVMASLGETLPRACVVPDDLGPAIVKADCPRLRLHPALGADYVVAALNSKPVRDMAATHVHGIGRPRLKLAELKKLVIPVPPAEEQRRIVSELHRHEERIAAGASHLDRGISAVERFRAATLATAFEAVDFKALDELAIVQSGIAKGRPGADASIELPYLRTANVQALRLDLDVIKTITVTSEQADKHRLQSGDVLILEGGDADKVGRGWIWDGQIEDCLHQNHVFAVRTNHDLLDPRYLAYYVNAPQARAYFGASAKQTTNLASINKRQLRALPVPVMDIEKQRRTVAALDEQLAAADALVATLRRHHARATDLRHAVRREAVLGRLVDQDSRDEPAAELLRRMAAERPSTTTKRRNKGRAVLIGG
jgi:type I restriction enzyme S subunit